MTGSSLSSTHGARAQRGFTLIEMSVCVIVLGLITAALIAPYNLYQRNKLLSYNEQVMQTVTSAIAAYKERNGFLPCPANAALASGDANFGHGNCIVGANFTVGVVPVWDLNLPYQAMLDAYNNKLTYAVTNSLTNNIVTDDAAGAVAPTGCFGPGQIQIEDGNIATRPAIMGRCAEFVVVSHGPDGKGGRGLDAAAAGVPCGVTALDVENCNGDASGIFVDANTNILGDINNANYFDDTLVYMLPPQENSAWMVGNNTATAAGSPGSMMVNRNMANVGIGTDNPSAALHVSGGDPTTGRGLQVGSDAGAAGTRGDIKAISAGSNIKVDAQRAQSKAFFYCTGADCL